jgi:hypothetical protein
VPGSGSAADDEQADDEDEDDELEGDAYRVLEARRFPPPASILCPRVCTPAAGVGSFSAAMVNATLLALPDRISLAPPRGHGHVVVFLVQRDQLVASLNRRACVPRSCNSQLFDEVGKIPIPQRNAMPCSAREARREATGNH